MPGPRFFGFPKTAVEGARVNLILDQGLKVADHGGESGSATFLLRCEESSKRRYQ